MTNAYPEKPVVPYLRTSIEMGLIINELKILPVDKQVKIMAYIIIRNESWNGKSGINSNYAGIQADSGRWQQKYDNAITGVVVKKENKTSKLRFFCAFRSYETCISMLADKLISRGMFIGGTTHFVTNMKIESVEDLCDAYYREWVKGEDDYDPTEQQLKDFKSMFSQGDKTFI